MGRSWVRLSAAALSGNDLGQVVHTPKQYNLVACELRDSELRLCEDFNLTRLYVTAIHGSNEQEEYCSSGSVAISDLDRLEPRYKLRYYFTGTFYFNTVIKFCQTHSLV